MTPEGAHVPTRLPIIILVCLFVIGAAANVSGADRRLTGTVVDPTGRTVPRAYVRVIDASGAAERAAFADEAGRFELTATDGAECRVEATLTGFQPAIAPFSLQDYSEALGYQPLGRVVRAGFRIGF
jgi:Carboxypeptidase regulatory-like domain